MPSRIINSHHALHAFITDVKRVAGKASADNVFEGQIREKKKDRSLAQNRLSFVWYQQYGQQSGNGKEYERNACKWDLGFPILMARENVDDHITKMYGILMSVTYEERVDAMEMVDVTSLFTVAEFTEYLQSMERRAAERGYHLTFPEDIYNEAMGRYRI